MRIHQARIWGCKLMLLILLGGLVWFVDGVSAQQRTLEPERAKPVPQIQREVRPKPVETKEVLPEAPAQGEIVTKQLAWNDPAVSTYECGHKLGGDSTDEDDCGNDVSGGCTSTLCGEHTLWPWTPLVQNQYNGYGYDSFQIILRNGWVVEGGRYRRREFLATDDEYIEGPIPDWDVQSYNDNPDVKEWRPKFKWSVSPGDTVLFDYEVTIKGPKGVPHY